MQILFKFCTVHMVHVVFMRQTFHGLLGLGHAKLVENRGSCVGLYCTKHTIV